MILGDSQRWRRGPGSAPMSRTLRSVGAASRRAFPMAMTRAISLAIALVALFIVRPAHASTFDRLTVALAQAVGEVPNGTHVVSAPLATDLPTPRGDELAVRLAALLAGRIGKGARPFERAVPLAVARGQTKDNSALLFLSPSLEKGQLRVTVDLYLVPQNGWDRIRTPVTAPRAHGFATQTIDAEVRAFFPPIALETAAITKAKLDDPEVLAAACGDIDGDGGLEVALVSRATVTLGRFSRGRFVVERTTPWSALSPRVPTPLREPIATAAFIEEDRLLVGISDRGGVAVDHELSPVSRLRGMPLDTVGLETCAMHVPDASALEGAGSCSTLTSSGSPASSLPAPRFDAAALATSGARSGAESMVAAARDPGGKVHVKFGEGQGEVRTFDGGAELAVYDLDLDGTPELALSNDGSGDDAVTIVSLERGNDGRVRRRIPTPSPVRALAACPPEQRASPGLIAVVGSEIWLVR